MDLEEHLDQLATACPKPIKAIKSRKKGIQRGVVTVLGGISDKDFKEKMRLKKLKAKEDKHNSISETKARCIDLAKAIAKIREKFTCRYCKKVVSGSNCHGSHIAPISSGNILCADPKNIIALCYHHHLIFWHKDPTKAGQWFRDTYPEEMKYVDENRTKEVHWKKQDWLEKEKMLHEQLKDISGLDD